MAPRSPPISGDVFQTAWSRTPSARIVGMSLARERGWLLHWDQAHWLYLLDHAGRSHAQRQFPHLSVACAADDASAYAAASSRGTVWWLAPDLMPRWQSQFHHPAQALALDSLGQYLAVANDRGRVYILDCTSREVGQIRLPRPIQHLSFVPGTPFLVASASYSLVTAFNIHGEVLWREGPVANIGAMSVDGEGKQTLLACFSEGIHRYNEHGKQLGRIATSEAVHLVSQSYTGDLILAGTMGKQLLVLNRDGQIHRKHTVEKPLIAIAFGPLGHDVFAALEDGPLLKLASA